MAMLLGHLLEKTGFTMSTKSMDQLIKGFFDNSLSDNDYRELCKNLDEKKKAKFKSTLHEETFKLAKIVLNEDSGTLIFESGMTLTLFKDGDVKLTYDGKPIELDYMTLRIAPLDLEQIYKHIIKLHLLDKKLAKSELDKVQQKTRYITTGNKRAFVAGMLMGKKLI